MAIDDTSTLIQVFEETIGDYVPTSTDLEAWTDLTAADGDDLVTTTVGLFGADLTDFLDNCALATEACTVADYDTFSGWAVGIQWVAADAPAAGLRQAASEQDNSVIFEDSGLYIDCYWYTPNEIWISEWTDEITADSPIYDDLTFDITDDTQDELDPFENWFGEIKDLTDQEQLMVHFQSSDDEIYYEVDSEATLWVHMDNAGGVATDVTFAGAATLTAAAGAILASLIF